MMDSEHINCLIETLSADLTDEQRNRAATFLRSHAAAFSKGEHDLGRND